MGTERSRRFEPVAVVCVLSESPGLSSEKKLRLTQILVYNVASHRRPSMTTPVFALSSLSPLAYF